MTKYTLDMTDGELIIAKSTKAKVKEHDMVNTHIYYSDHRHAPAGLKDAKLGIWVWENIWFKLDTEGKKNIIKTKFKVAK